MRARIAVTAIGIGLLGYAGMAGAALDSNKFLSEAAQGGKTEVQISQLALEKAASPEVKQYAQRLLDDHTKMNQEVQDLATQKNIQLPADASAQGQAEHQKLATLSGKKFDKEFLSFNVKDHRKDVSDFKKEAKSATDPDIKQLAEKSLPTLEQHLQMAQKLAKNVK